MIQVDLAIEAEGWPPEADILALAATAFAHACDEADIEPSFVVSLLLTNDAAVRDLNREWRGQDKPTNVLSFPGSDMPGPDGVVFLGDIALARETIAREAAGDGKTFTDHLTHLMVHGLLHLAGYDHEDDAEAEEMEALETRILARLAIADPYAVEHG
ncbi:MAG: rRNA maturation RNase YbeY [Rhizobiaceae bacterium]|jgi:probable rRNA maturation factor|nr:rRNA maturation RNase YbeY [Rhizobiaceae bacterium]